jgi:hypothetical protein
MNRHWLRFLVAAGLFVGWIGWLAYLAFTDAAPPVLSEPQLIAATADLVAEVQAGPDGKAVAAVKVRRWLTTGPDGPTITVTNLPECQGFEGPGEYLLPLVADGKDYRVALPTRSPGIDPRGNGSIKRVSIYRRTPEVEQQWARLHPPA